MCFIVFAYNCHPDYLLVMAANRDEYHARPTSPAGFWKEDPGVLAGKDLEQGGAWMGITRRGRLAALTNYRDPSSIKPGAPSRGNLVKDFLLSGVEPRAYLGKLDKKGESYNGFNLLLMDEGVMWYYSNRDKCPRKVSPGIHGLSNHLLDTPWHKVEKGKKALDNIIRSSGHIQPDSLFKLLSDEKRAPDGDLPRTGVPLEWERLLSPVFIRSETYGTRSSTVLLVERRGRITFCERSFGKNGLPSGKEVKYIFLQADADSQGKGGI
ncbi:MAG: NRDE family protein [Bacillota bacterium]